MARANEMIKRIQAARANLSDTISKVSAENTEIFADANRAQLLAGKDRNGDNLPSYYDDVGKYFKDREAADDYVLFKSNVSPSKDKPPDVRDYYIDGTYHRTIDARVSGNKLDIFSPADIYPDVMRATNGKAHGINPNSASLLWEHVIGVAVRKEITEQTGIKSSYG